VVVAHFRFHSWGIARFHRVVNETCVLIYFTQRRMTVPYRRFGTTCRSHHQEDGTDNLCQNVVYELLFYAA